MIRVLRKYAYKFYKNTEIRRHRLNYLFLEITRRCNLSCLHCGSDCTRESAPFELTTDSWFKIIDYFCRYYPDPFIFVLTGGEPSLHPDFHKIILYIASKNKEWGVVTNGYALKESDIAMWKERGSASVTVSLDGLEDSHNFLRGRESAFSRVTDRIKLFVKYHLSFDVVTCVYPRNIGELDRIAEFLISHNVNSWRLFRIFPIGRAVKNRFLFLSFEETHVLINWIKERKTYYKKRGLRIHLSCEGFLPFEEDLRVRDDPFFCRAGVSVASILCDGTVTGCPNNHSSFYVGNILKDNFTDLWENRFDIMRKRNWIWEKNCASCEYVKDCRGGSIHLWDLKCQNPRFCYTKPVTADHGGLISTR